MDKLQFLELVLQWQDSLIQFGFLICAIIALMLQVNKSSKNKKRSKNKKGSRKKNRAQKKPISSAKRNRLKK